MNKVTKSTIKMLAEEQTGKVVSMYMPTHRYPSPPHIQESQTRFKNMLHSARQIVDDAGPEAKGLQKNLKSLERLIDDLPFWQSTLEGLAIFVSESDVQMYHLPIECEESVYVADSYDITPLLIMESYDQPFYVLALAQHDSKLFRGDSYGMEPVEIDLPKSVEDALNIDEMFSGSSTKRSHQGGPSGARDVTAPHGEGDSQGAGSEERLQYFRMIDEKLASDPAVDSTLPMLVAAAENEAGDYLAISKLPSLMDCFLKGNYTQTPMQELHKRAWPMIHEKIVKQKDMKLVEQFNEFRGVDKASTKLKDIEKAAADGRIDTLLINMIDETRDSIIDSAHDQAVPVIRMMSDMGMKKLKDLACLVYRSGGKMIGLDRSSMPDGAMAAALYRY